MSEENTLNFSTLGLPDPLLKALDEVGYEVPSPIQAKTIPLVLSRRDVIGQAQTGTGKTAAFALPILANIDLDKKETQTLVLAPTRELAIQVSEAFQRYAHHLKNFRVLPIYGGQDYGGQLRQLRRGAHVVVGTPGRVMDHMRRETLKLDQLSSLVLDEADEMLRMGFIDDVEWILEQTPPERQIALFSATMPPVIRRIAQKHLQDPVEIIIKVKTTTAETISQHFMRVHGPMKLEALTRILEAETFDGMIIFVRTKTATVELSEKLEARGFAASPLNGDIPQNLRERTVERLKAGQVDILVATDVAARGLDVDRISHVVNYDIPYDVESYVHRIGRTGRAGRTGEAILFVAPREMRLLRAIERATKHRIEPMKLPATKVINIKRIERFKQRIADTLENEDLDFFRNLINEYGEEHELEPMEIAAALAKMVQGDQPLLLEDLPQPSFQRESSSRGPRSRDRAPGPPGFGMDRYRLEVGHIHGVKPGNIVGAIANETGINSRHIGRINIFDDYSTVDLPESMPSDVFQSLKKVWVAGRRLNISRMDSDRGNRGSKYGNKGGKNSGGKPSNR